MDSRRKFIGSISSIGMISITGCIAPLYEEENNENSNNIEEENENNFSCEGECDIIKNVNIESHSGVESFTDVSIKFEKTIPRISLTIETYNDEGELNGIRNIKKSINSTGVMAEFNNYKTGSLDNVNVIVHYWEK